jgi:uncharacterized coiled-coil DUF342 family protein
MRKKWDKYNMASNGETHKYLYYNCGTYRDFSKSTKGLTEEEKQRVPKCTSHYISDKTIRNIVIDDINIIIGQLQDFENMVKKELTSSKGVSRYDKVKKEISSRQNSIKTLNNRLDSAKDKWLDGYMTNDEYMKYKLKVEGDITQYEMEISSLQESVNKTQKTLENSWVKSLLEMGKLQELDRGTVIRLIDAIYVYQDKHIEIVYKFSDEFDNLFAKSTFGN